MSNVSYKVQCGQSFVEYQSDSEYKSHEQIKELAVLVTEMEVRRLNRDMDIGESSCEKAY